MMLIKCIEEIEEWVVNHHTYPEMIEWASKYLLWQGRANFMDLGDMS